MNTPQPSVGLAAVIASIAIPFAQVVAPVFQEIWTVDAKLEVEQGIADGKLRVEKAVADDKHNEQVANILLRSFIDQDARDQQGAIAIIGAIFPGHALRLQEAFDRLAVNDTVRSSADKVIAQIEGIASTRVEAAREQERSGFEALASGDAERAKAHFAAAFKSYPTFHNVDEISRKLDTLDAGDSVAVRRTIDLIVKENSWRMPADIKVRLQQRSAPR